MAANFWTSTHYLNWLRNAGTIMEEVSQLRLRDSEFLTEEEMNKIQISFAQLISTLARKTGLRQRVAATAIVYFKRFYLRSGFIDHDPRLIAPVALYLAAKVEEHTVTARHIISQLSMLYKGDHSYPYKVTDLYNYEFLLIAELDFDLIVYHPYRPLMQYCNDQSVSSHLQVAWAIVNDSYRTDVSLFYPPFIIALAAIYMAGTLANKSMDDWVEKMNIKACELSDVVRAISVVYSPSKPIKAGSGKDMLGEVLNGKLQVHFAPKVKQSQNEHLEARMNATSVKTKG